MKVYLVSTGEYSDWNIVGLYSTMERATDAKIRLYAENDIEELEVDKDITAPKLGEYLWLIQFNEDGNVIEWSTQRAELRERRRASVYGCVKYGFRVNVQLFATTLEDAVKSASEGRLAALANALEFQRRGWVEV